jgi:PAS domain-containing protein
VREGLQAKPGKASKDVPPGNAGQPEAPVEAMADSLAVALSRREAEETLRQSEARYRGLFEHMSEGYAYCRMIFENGEPRDFVYLSINSAFETLTGLRNVTGRRVSEVIPGIREADPACSRSTAGCR